MVTEPRRGDIWLVHLNPVRGHEQAGTRPVLIVSHDTFNRGPADLLIVLPITSRVRHIASHVVIQPPEGGLTNQSAILCEAIRSVAKERLIRALGFVTPQTLEAINDRLRILLVL